MGARVRVAELVERTCRRCSSTKPVALFTSDRGLSTTLCRECNSEVCAERYAANRESRAAEQRARRAVKLATDADALHADEHYNYWLRKKRDPVGYLLARLKRAAKAKGVPFDLGPEDIFVPLFCPVLGIPLRAIGTGRGDDCPEADRLVPSLGYVRGNVTIISHRANRLKDNGSAAEHERIAAWMRSRETP